MARLNTAAATAGDLLGGDLLGRDRRAPSSTEALERALEYFTSLPGDHAASLLRSAGLRRSGTKVTVHDRLRAALRTGKLNANQLAAALDAAEGWGNHQVHLYTVTEAACRRIDKAGKFRAKLKAAGLDGLLDGEKPLWPQAEPTLFCVNLQANRLRVGWAQTREYEVREPEKDHSKDNLRFKAFRIHHRRTFCYFDLDLPTGEAALIMGKLPSGNDYAELRDRLLSDLDPLVASDALTQIDLRPTLSKLEKLKTDQLRRRRMKLSTLRQSTIEITSGGLSDDAYADPLIFESRHRWSSGVAPAYGFFYWPVATDGIERWIGTRVQPGDGRFSIDGHCTEAEVMHVLRRMRAAG